MLDDIKLLLSISDTSKDSLLTKLLNKAQQQALDYCNTSVSNYIDGLPTGLQDIIIELAIIRYNKLGSEGLQSESYSGISQSFIADIPADIKQQLNSYRHLKTL